VQLHNLPNEKRELNIFIEWPRWYGRRCVVYLLTRNTGIRRAGVLCPPLWYIHDCL